MPASYQDHIQAAIATIESAIKILENQGTRPGCITESCTGDGYVQWHWCHGKKRTYVKKPLVTEYQAEIDRHREAETLRGRIELLTQACY
jgi:hypothetical protein